jgi:hypothetical protein
VTCIQNDESAVRKSLGKATTLTYEFYPAAAPASGRTTPAAGASPGGGGAAAPSAAAAGEPGGLAGGLGAAVVPAAPGGPVRIVLPGLNKYTETEDETLRQLCRHYGVPCEARFDLLCRARVARAFGTLAGRRRAVRQRLLALCLLLHSAPQHVVAEDLAAVFAAEPDMVPELITIVQVRGGRVCCRRRGG